MGMIGNRPAGHSAGIGTSVRRLRIAYRSVGSDHTGWPGDGRAAGGVFATFERNILRERLRAGLAHAQQNGMRLGRPLSAGLHADQVRKLYCSGLSKSEISRRLNIGRTSVRRILYEGT